METLLLANLSDSVSKAVTLVLLYKKPLIRISSWIKISVRGIFLSAESSSYQGEKALQKIKKLFIQYVDVPASKPPVDKYNVSAGFPAEKKVSYNAKLSPVILILLLTLAGCGAPGEEATGNRAYTPTTYGSITLVWDEPTTRENGDPLTNIENYKVFYGKVSGVYTDSIDVGTNEFGYPTCVLLECTYTIQQIPVGVYYFAITVYDLTGMESLYSNEKSATVS